MVSLLRKTEKGTCAAVVVEVKNVKSVRVKKIQGKLKPGKVK